VAASVGSAIGLLIAGFLLKLHLVEWVLLIGAAALIGVVVFLWRRQAAARAALLDKMATTSADNSTPPDQTASPAQETSS